MGMLPRTLPRLLEIIGLLSIFWLVFTPILMYITVLIDGKMIVLNTDFFINIGYCYWMMMIVMIGIYTFGYIIVGED